MEKTAFSFQNYYFTKVKIEFPKQTGNQLNVKFSPKGEFFKEITVC